MPSVSDFSGVVFVTSRLSAQVAKRRPGVVGLCLRTGIRPSPREIDRWRRGGASDARGARVCRGSRERRLLRRRATDNARRRRFAVSLRDLLALEELDRVLRVQGHDGLLPAPAAAARVAAPLRLGLHPGGAHAGHAHAEDLLDRLAHLRLVGALVDAERVLARREQRVALLRDHRPDDHLAGVHDALLVSCSRAASEATRRAAPTRSATPTWSACSTDTPVMLRNDLPQASSPSASTTTALPPSPKPARASKACLVEGASKPAASSAPSEPRSAWRVSAARSARRRAWRFTFTV